jgi:hypothetical protein
MALLDRFDKQPTEIKKYQIDYSEWLPTGHVDCSPKRSGLASQHSRRSGGSSPKG